MGVRPGSAGSGWFSPALACACSPPHGRVPPRRLLKRDVEELGPFRGAELVVIEIDRGRTAHPAQDLANLLELVEAIIEIEHPVRGIVARRKAATRGIGRAGTEGQVGAERPVGAGELRCAIDGDHRGLTVRGAAISHVIEPGDDPEIGEDTIGAGVPDAHEGLEERADVRRARRRDAEDLPRLRPRAGRRLASHANLLDPVSRSAERKFLLGPYATRGPPARDSRGPAPARCTMTPFLPCGR